VDVQVNYENSFEIPILTEDQWLKALEECVTTNQFVRKFVPFLSEEKEATRLKTLCAKYSKLLRDEKVSEGGAVKRLLVNYYDKLLIDAGLQSPIINSENKVDKDLLEFYMSSNPITEHDIERFSTIDNNLLLNKFVYKNMNIDMLAQLVYERYTQYKPVNLSQKFIDKTSESNIDGLIDTLIKETLQDLKKKIQVRIQLYKIVKRLPV